MLNIGPLSSSAIQMLTLVHFAVSCCLSDYWFKSKVDCGWTFPFPQFRVGATNVGAISDLSHRHFSSVLSLMVCGFFLCGICWQSEKYGLLIEAPFEESRRARSVRAGNAGIARRSLHKYLNTLHNCTRFSGDSSGSRSCWAADSAPIEALFNPTVHLNFTSLHLVQ